MDTLPVISHPLGGKARTQIITAFHTNAGHVTLHDQAYNTDRMVSTGNPYKQLVAELMKRECGVDFAGRPRLATTGGMKTCFPESRSKPTPCKECHSWCRNGSCKSRNGTNTQTPLCGHGHEVFPATAEIEVNLNPGDAGTRATGKIDRKKS